MKKLFTTVLFALSSYGIAIAQMPHDAIYMPKKTACIAVSYGNSRWNEYWENTLKRDNQNIGTHTTQSIMPMIAAGFTDKLNIIVGLPYISTKTSQGNLMGQNGFQDASAWIKYKALSKTNLSIHGIVGGSVPVTNYVADFMPMSIGMKAKTATARLLVNFQNSAGLYATAHGSYTLRSNIRIDRDAYLAYDKMYNTDVVPVPNTIDAAARLGYLKKAIQTEAFIEYFSCVTGDNIRRNDMPFPTNKMQMTNIGLYGKYQPKNIGINARASYTVQGLNVGQSFMYSVGLLYQLNHIKF